MTITELYDLAEQAMDAFLALRAELPSGHPLQGEVQTMIKMTDQLQVRIENANEIYRKKLPV